MLVNKRILFISIQFFNYENIIKEQLEKMGAVVDFYDDRPSNSFFSKAIIRLKKEVYAVKINKYFKTIIDEIKDHVYDYFLLIKGEATPKFFLEFLRKNNPNIRFIYYTCDSFENNRNGLHILNYFDSKFTFDSNDAIKFKMRFRPLFFAQEYSEINKCYTEFRYDLAFIGTVHSDRYTISEFASKWCSKRKFKMFNFHFSPSRILFNFKKLTDSSFRKFDINKISFKSLSHSEIIDIYRTTKIILDINHPGQSGLTMRTFETLGAGRKLITTNSKVRLYPFFDPQNIYIINRDKISFDEDFFKTDFKPISSNILNIMSLKGWIEEIFDLNKRDSWIDVIR